MPTSTNYDVIVLGAGAAGLMVAAQAARRGRNVLILEKSNKPGKKILMSGGGKCNFTNLSVDAEHYISHNPNFVISALPRYTNWDFISLVSDYHIEYEERQHGRLFTVNGSREILNMLLRECEKTTKVTIQTNCTITDITHCSHSAHFKVKTKAQGNFQAESLIVATGGLSIPTLGGSGFGYTVAEQFGHHIFSTQAGLVPFTFSDHFKDITQRLTGNALNVSLSNDKKSFNESLLFTHRGLSGPSSLQLSNYWSSGESITIDFFPDVDLIHYLKQKKYQQPKLLLRTLLSSFCARSIVLELQQLVWPANADIEISQLSDALLEEIASHLHHFNIKPSGTEGYRTAEVTLGGIDTREISSKTMQSKYVDGLYFIGEVVDVTGHLGGYNFQWAWSSAFAAAQYV